MPLDKPVTVIGEEDPETPTPVFDCALKPVIAEPPTSVGAVNATLTEASPAVPVTPVGCLVRSARLDL